MLHIARTRCDYWRPIATTTRRARPDETDGHDYHFVTREDFKSQLRAHAFTEWDYTIGNYYGYGVELARRHRGRAAIVAVTARVGLRLAERLPAVHLLFLDADDDVLDGRVRTRGHHESEIVLREAHRDEEREHAELFDERQHMGDDWHDDDVVAYLDQVRGRYADQ